VLAEQGPSAHLPALKAIPRHLRLMYLHAAQSFFWNAAASARVRAGGLAVAAGDLVLPGPPWPDGAFGADGALPGVAIGAAGKRAAETAQAGSVGSDAALDERGGAAKARKLTDGGGAVAAAGEGRASAKTRIERMRVVTSQDVAEGRYCIEEVALPLPGGDVLAGAEAAATAAAAEAGVNEDTSAPASDAAASGTAAGGAGAGAAEAADTASASAWALYEQIAQQQRVPLRASAHDVPEFSLSGLSGDYRRLVVRPRALAHRFVRHARLDDDVVATGVPDPPPPARDGQPAAVEVRPGFALPPPPSRPCSAGKSSAAGGSNVKCPQDAALPLQSPEPAAQVSDAALHPAHAASAREPGTREQLLLDDAYGGPDGSVVELSGGGARLLLVLSFALPASAYATMLVRELLKASTAAADHKAASCAKLA
jgi:tRNA pseudouridine synthase D (TruD)